LFILLGIYIPVGQKVKTGNPVQVVVDPVMLLVAFIIGLAAGILSGMFGIGGGIIMVPALLAVGLQSGFGEATAASLFAIIFLSPTGSYVHFREKHLNVKYGVVLGMAGITGGVLGSYFSKSVAQNWLELFFGIFAVFMGIQMVLKNHNTKKAAERTVSGKDGMNETGTGNGNVGRDGTATVKGKDGKACKVDDDTKESTECTMRNPYPYLVGAGFCAGILAGVMGVGGGLIMVPIMVLLGMGIHVAIGTSLLAIIFTASASVITKASFNLLDIWTAIPLAAGGCIAAYCGAMIASKTRSKELARYFSVLLFIISAYMMLKSFGVIG